jgi:hypothetical protein
VKTHTPSVKPAGGGAHIPAPKPAAAKPSLPKLKGK